MLNKDQRYIYGIKANNEQLVHEISNVFYPEIENFVFLNGGTKADATDIFKDALTNIWENLQIEDIDLSIPFGAYFYLEYRSMWLIRNRTIQNKTITDLGNYVEYIQIADADEEKTRYIETDERKDALIEILKPCISDLDSKSRLIYQLKYLFEKNEGEIAKILKMPSADKVHQAVDKCNIKLIKLLKSYSEYTHLADDTNFQNELESVLIEHYKQEANIDSDYREDFQEILDRSLESKIDSNSINGAKGNSTNHSNSKRLLSRTGFLAVGILLLSASFYFLNSRNSTASLADYYYFPYQYESNVAKKISKIESEPIQIDNNTTIVSNSSAEPAASVKSPTTSNNNTKVANIPKPSAKEISNNNKSNVSKSSTKPFQPTAEEVIKDDNGMIKENSTKPVEKIGDDTNRNYKDVLQLPNNNSIGNLKLLLAKASNEYDLGKYKDAIVTLNAVLNKTANNDVKNDANWYLALCYLKRTNKKQAIKLLKQQSEISTHYDIAQELIEDLE